VPHVDPQTIGSNLKCEFASAQWHHLFAIFEDSGCAAALQECFDGPQEFR
jgi:hypothetical protein